MKSGFLNSNKKDAATTPIIAPTMNVPSKDSLKGLKKGALKNYIIETAEHANAHINELHEENMRLNNELNKAKARIEKARKEAAEATKTANTLREKSAELAKTSFYIKNLDMIPRLSDLCKLCGFKLTFKESVIIVTFGTITHSAQTDRAQTDRAQTDRAQTDRAQTDRTHPAQQSDYGVWIRDMGIDHKFEVRPYFADSHTHLNNVPCSGRKVEGNDSLIATLKEFACRKEEFEGGVHSSASSLASSLREFLESMSTHPSRSSDE